MYQVYFSIKGSRCWSPVFVLELDKQRALILARACLTCWPDRRWGVGPKWANGIEEIDAEVVKPLPKEAAGEISQIHPSISTNDTN